MNHDALIDRIARDMTDAEPRADFRARVLSHVSPRSRWPRETLRAGLVAAAAAICAWAFLPARHVAVPVERPSLTAHAQSPQRLQAVDEPLATRARATVATPSEEELAWRARAIPALPPVAPIAVEPIQPPGLSIAPISVLPIVSDPITLGAVDARTGGR